MSTEADDRWPWTTIEARPSDYRVVSDSRIGFICISSYSLKTFLCRIMSRGACQGNFGPEKLGPRDQYSTKIMVPLDRDFHGISVLLWNFGPLCKKNINLTSKFILTAYKYKTRFIAICKQHKKSSTIHRVSNRKYESMQNQSTAVFPSRSTIGKIETIPQMGMTLKMFAPNAILNQQC